jgi:hypothetical protein
MRPSTHEGLPNLRQAPLAARPRAVLEGVLSVAASSLESGIGATLNDLEQQLFKLAEQAKSNDQQNRCFETLREIRRGRSDVAPRFVIRLEAALASIDAAQLAPDFARINRNQRQDLTLVDPEEFEQMLALQEVASKCEIRHSQPLFALGQRFGVLAGSAAMEADELPVGPHRLCECLKHAAACLDIQLEHRVLMYRVFDRVCMAHLGKLYDQLNELCVEHRILPNLHFVTPRTKRAEGAAPPEPRAPDGRHPAGHARHEGGEDASQMALGATGSADTHGGSHGGSHGGTHGGEHPQGGGAPAHARGGSAGGAAAGFSGGSHEAYADHGDGAAPDATPGRGGMSGRGGAGGFGGGGSGGQGGGGQAGGGHAGTHGGSGSGSGGFGGGGGGRGGGQQAGAGSRGGDPGGMQGRSTDPPHGRGDFHGQGAQRQSAPVPVVPEGPVDPRLAGFQNPMTGWPGTPSAPAVDHSQADARDAEVFDTMRELLAGRRHTLGLQPPPGSESAHQARSEDVQSVLSALQSKPAPPMMIGGKLVPRSISHLKQDLLSQLRQLTPDGKPPRLGEVETDTMDLVGMLFEHLGKDTKADSAVQSLLTRLQIPLLRVALRDKSFFTRRAHPARQLLNAVAEGGLYWLDDESDDRALVEKMRLVVDRVTAEYDDNLDVFEDLLGDLSKHLGTLARKSEVAERRHVDAARGRERLDLARQTATKAIEERLSRKNPPALIRTLLEQAWTDVLALTILRQGEGSDTYRRRLQVADHLIDVLSAETQGLALREEPAQKALKHEVETGLTQVGYHGDDVNAVVNRLFGGAPASNDEGASLTELAIKLKSRARLGGEAEKDVKATEKEARPVKLLTPLTPEEQRVFERLRTIPFGTWFEFVTNQQGDSVRRKLSWFSTVTGRCLFVNQRGVRVEEKTLEQLAREIVRGSAKVIEAQKESLIDRAWNAIMSTLRGFAGKSPQPAPASA